VLIRLMAEQPGLQCTLVMRNWDQVFKYHIEEIRKSSDFRPLNENLKVTSPASLKIGTSQLDFSYAENLQDVIRRFRSANIDVLVVDQSEQFTEAEIREMRQAARSKSGKPAKLVLSFNMRGAGIDFHRNWFHLRRVGAEESADDFRFVKYNPWDNAQWVLTALEEDGYAVKEDYYQWTDEQRKRYAAKRGSYTKQLASLDPVVRKADWDGDWDSIEGTYFQNSFDLDATRISAGKVEALRKPTATHWMSSDWGKAHWWPTYWHFRVGLSPSEVETILGWTVDAPLNVTVTYRELIKNEVTPDQMARLQIAATPEHERSRIRAYFLSPEQVTGEPGSVGAQQARELRAAGMPGPAKADNDRIGGWSLMDRLLRGTKYAGHDPTTLRITCNACGHSTIAPAGTHSKCTRCGSISLRAVPSQCSDVWLISAECPELLESIPKLIRDPKKIDDCLRLDETSARVEQDIADAVRYGLKTMLAPRRKTAEDEFRERMAATADPAQRMMIGAAHALRKNKPKSYWAQRFKQGALKRPR
jgi:hypothetical protein